MKSISDVVGASGLSGYAEVALLIFFAVFVLVAMRVFTAHRDELERAARIPLDDNETPAESTSDGRRN